MSERLTAERLEITQAEYDALVWIRDALDPAVPDVVLPEWLYFDMSYWLDNHEEYYPGKGCGTIACLGGSMKLRMAGLSEAPMVALSSGMDDPAFDKVAGGSHDHSEALDGLFYAFPRGKRWSSRRNQALAVLAVDCFLSGERREPWKKAIVLQQGARK